MPLAELAKNRRWGFEIENAELNRFADLVEDAGFELCHDSSVSFDCNCECGECRHTCDCERCENRWDDEDEHCGDVRCQGNELNSPVFHEPKPERAEVLNDLANRLGHWSQTDEHAGMHIHIEARDLNISQLQTVLTVWNKLVNLDEATNDFSFLGRVPNQYCRINSKRLPENSDKMLQVNFQNLLMFDGWAGIVEAKLDGHDINPSPYGPQPDTLKTTVEFRGFAPSFNSDSVFHRAKVCRQVVEFAKSGQAPYWLLQTKTLPDFLQMLASS